MGVIGEDLVGFGLGADNCTDGMVMGEEGAEDVGA